MRLRYGFDILLLFAACALLAACGGGGGEADSSFVAPSVGTLTIAGYVEDGAVSGARVSLVDQAGDVVRRCWASGQGRCEATTDDSGHFRIDLAQDADPSSWTLVATGGRDSVTGIGFTDVPLDLSAPAGAFSSLSQIVVSPLTTLLARRVGSGQPLNQARAAVAAWMGLSAPDDVLARPTSSAELLQRNLVLMGVVLQLFQRGDAAPWKTLAARLDRAPMLVDGSGRVSVQELSAGLGLAAAETAALEGLADDLVAASGGVAFRRFNRHMLAQVLGPELDDVLRGADPTFDTTDARYLANREALFDQLMLQGDRVPLWDWIPQRLLQHLLFAYGLDDPDRFLQPDTARFVAGLVRTENGIVYTPADDPRIGEILSGRPRISVRSPLPADRLLPAGDNRARIAYYYGSDRSHLYRADTLAQAVLDDQLNDELMIELIRGIARSGMVRGWVADPLLPYDPWRMIDNRIFNPVNRALARIELAEGAARWGFSTDALDALAQAEQELRAVLDAKGTAFFSAADAADFRRLAQGYLHAGDFASAVAVLRYLHRDIAVPVGTYLAYDNAFSAGLGIADQLLADGDVTGALVVIDELRQIAVETPPNLSSSGTPLYFKAKVNHLVETARRYARAGSAQDVLDLYYGAGMIVDLRSSDGLSNKTGSKTRSFMDDMAVALYLAGDKEGALALLDTLSGLSRSWGYKQLAAEVAVAEAAAGGLQPAHATEPPVAEMTALDLVYYRVPTDLFNPTSLETQVEALTYYVANRKKPYLGLRLIEESFDVSAATALRLATELTRRIDINRAKKVGTKILGSARINFGLAKIADLYLDLGMTAEARQLLIEAEQEVAAMSDPSLVAMALAGIGDVYLRLGDATTARDLLSRAGQELSLDAYDTLIGAMLRAGASGVDLQIDAYGYLAWSLYPAAATDRDRFAVARHLRQAARYAHAIGRQTQAREFLEQLRQVCLAVDDPQDRLDKLVEWAAAYAEIGDYERALGAVRRVEEEGFRIGRNKALLAIGKVYARRDDLGRRDLAVVDMDADGRPDFFHPLVSQHEIDASGLMLDTDMDGDGLPDEQDARPMFFDGGNP